MDTSDAQSGLVLDRFQRQAIEHIDDGFSVLVSAPTGSGKTLVAEHAVDQALASGLRAFYTTPIKALSNQKYRDLLLRLEPGQVGLLTGDNAVNGDADVVVMTTEVLRNMLYSNDADDRLGVVVLDEVHYLSDAYRGPVWEEVILHLRESVRLVCLSATVSNYSELGDWLERVHGPVAVVSERERPVPLTNMYAVGRRHGGLHLMETFDGDGPNAAARRFDAPPTAEPHDRRSRRGNRNPPPRQRRGNRNPPPRQRRGNRNPPPRQRRSNRNRIPWCSPRRGDMLDELDERDLLPTIWFIFSRKGCDQAAEQLIRLGVRYTDDDCRDAHQRTDRSGIGPD